jgi:hypothetical protein
VFSPVISNIKTSVVKQRVLPRGYILRALGYYRDHEATGPRDKVHRRVGLLYAHFEFDVPTLNIYYSKPVRDVYTDAAIEILRIVQDLDMLERVAHTADYIVSPIYPSLVSRWDFQQR